jgi:branched-chain amino acid transport system substrate-binding protein
MTAFKLDSFGHVTLTCLIKAALFLVLSLVIFIVQANANEKRPILIGLTAEFGVENSASAQSIEKGIALAMHEINSNGGINGRPLKLMSKDDRGVPARGVDHFKEFATHPDVVAVFGGRFSPVAIEVSKLANSQRLLFLAPWSAADVITRQPSPNYVFRSSMIDSWAMEVMLNYSLSKRYKKLVLMVPNTAWGRSAALAFDTHQKKRDQTQYFVLKYNWGDNDFSDEISRIQSFGAKAIVMVANETEAVPFVKQLAKLPARQRLPIISHWGILGGDFAKMVGADLHKIDLTVVHTFSFAHNNSMMAKHVSNVVKSYYGLDVRKLPAQVGFAHAYDLMHMLAKAIELSGNADRENVHDKLERLSSHQGLVRNYIQPFASDDHEALDIHQLAMGRFDEYGNVKKIQW